MTVKLRIWCAFVLACIASIVFSVVPTYTSGPPLHRETLAHVNGTAAYVLLAIPVLFAALPLVVQPRWARILSTAVLFALVIAGIASVGVLYAPAAAMMIWATLDP